MTVEVPAEGRWACFNLSKRSEASGSTSPLDLLMGTWNIPGMAKSSVKGGPVVQVAVSIYTLQISVLPYACVCVCAC